MGPWPATPHHRIRQWGVKGSPINALWQYTAKEINRGKERTEVSGQKEDNVISAITHSGDGEK